MASKRKMIKRIELELWVMDKAGIPKEHKITDRKVQDVKIPGFLLTIGEALLILDLLRAK